MVVTAAARPGRGGIVEKESPVSLSLSFGVKLPGFVPPYL